MTGGWKKSLALAAFGLMLRAAGAQETPPYKNPALPFDQRVANLLSLMSLAEKADQMQVVIPANPKFGIPAMRWGTEGLHGVPGNTVFPDAMAMGATFDPDLIKKVASAIGDDARIRGNSNNTGLILWCPTVNMVRDPRWGRNMETFGEDPFLSGRLGAAYCSGMQGDDPKYLKVIATPKHFAVYSQELQRNSANAVVSQRALREYYLPAFEACFTEGHAASTMSAYNAINGIPCSADAWLLTNVLRNEWHFSGAVCTDSRAVTMIYSAHRYTDNEEDAVVAAINAGVDVITDIAAVGQNRISSMILSANAAGKIKNETIDRAAGNSLMARFRLGIFDPGLNPYAQLRGTDKRVADQTALALQAARESIVLLQNSPAPRGFGFGPLLPLDLRRINSIAILGPYAAASLYGSYSQGTAAPMGAAVGAPRFDNNRGPTPLDAIRALVGDRVAIRTAADTQSQLDAARTSDVVLFIGGNDTRVDRAGTDRSTLDLPNDQTGLLTQITRANPLTILVLTGGSAINLQDLKPKCPAIVMDWYNGEQGGNALAEVLLGVTNPAGRLPITFYRSMAEQSLPPMDDYEVITGRTYLYCKKPVSFPFGHGLSYTTFAYDGLKISPPPATAAPNPDLTRPITITFQLANTGSRAGDEVAQVYVRQINPHIIRPLKQLVAMARMTLAPGENKTLTCTVPLKGLAYWNDADHAWTVDPGDYEFLVGASSEDIRLRGTYNLP